MAFSVLAWKWLAKFKMCTACTTPDTNSKAEKYKHPYNKGTLAWPQSVQIMQVPLYGVSFKFWLTAELLTSGWRVNCHLCTLAYSTSVVALLHLLIAASHRALLHHVYSKFPLANKRSWCSTSDLTMLTWSTCRHCMCRPWTPEYWRIDRLSGLCLGLVLFSLCIAVATFS